MGNNTSVPVWVQGPADTIELHKGVSYYDLATNQTANAAGAADPGQAEENRVTTQIVILAAGMGSRLGRSLPKPLTELGDGRSIMQQQFDNIRHAFGSTARVTIVVGYKLESIIEAFPDAAYVYNEQYDQTNTSKSLMRALQASTAGGVLWMNGDVVFDPTALDRAVKMVARDQSFVSVNTARVADEEVKYTVDVEGFIKEISKTVAEGLGEAVGINYISKNDKAVLLRQLRRVADQDYFERGLELAIEQDGIRVEPLDISDLYAVEVDFLEDLERANLFV
jgi:choline kinase